MKQLNRNYEQVVALLNKGGEFNSLTALNVYNVLKKPKKTAAVMLRRLEKEYGYLKGDAIGVYRLTEEGEKYLDNLKK